MAELAVLKSLISSPVANESHSPILIRSVKAERRSRYWLSKVPSFSLVKTSAIPQGSVVIVGFF
jgi:hypothetical protein